MLASMTSFSRQSHEDTYGCLTWECRTVNHRYLEMSIRMPEAFRHQETLVRERIQQRLKRGKVEVTLKYQPGTDVPYDLVLNKKLAEQLSGVSQQLDALFPQLSTSVFNALTWQGMLQIKETHMDQVVQSAMTLLDKSLDELVASRHREGEKLQDFMQQRITAIREQMTVVKASAPQALELQRKKVLNRFEELKLTLDQDRLEQEMVWLVQKADIAEELQRLDSHLQEVERVLSNGGVVGRRLDFFMQELNRETNTIGSKSMDADVSQAVIELKVFIEQMREQVQNIE